MSGTGHKLQCMASAVHDISKCKGAISLFDHVVYMLRAFELCVAVASPLLPALAFNCMFLGADE